jgi:hypothetical protein
MFTVAFLAPCLKCTKRFIRPLRETQGCLVDLVYKMPHTVFDNVSLPVAYFVQRTNEQELISC